MTMEHQERIQLENEEKQKDKENAHPLICRSVTPPLIGFIKKKN